jgi:hypothetical protein
VIDSDGEVVDEEEPEEEPYDVEVVYTHRTLVLATEPDAVEELEDAEDLLVAPQGDGQLEDPQERDLSADAQIARAEEALERAEQQAFMEHEDPEYFNAWFAALDPVDGSVNQAVLEEALVTVAGRDRVGVPDLTYDAEPMQDSDVQPVAPSPPAEEAPQQTFERLG